MVGAGELAETSLPMQEILGVVSWDLSKDGFNRAISPPVLLGCPNSGGLALEKPQDDFLMAGLKAELRREFWSGKGAVERGPRREDLTDFDILH